jgi:predicted acetyltransferase
MSYNIIKGSPTDYDDIIDFGNYVFNIDFPSLLPKIYRNHKEMAQYHHIVKEENKIKAMVGSFPLDLTVCDNYLKGRGIGTVSVHRYSRNSGYMKLLMDKAIAEIKADGSDFAVLSGQRQRYEYWGFTPCGINLNLYFNNSNIKHCDIDIKDNYKFAEYSDNVANDLAQAINLYNSQTVHAIREKDNFIEISKSWSNCILFIYKNDTFIGYLCTSENREKINEILLLNPDEIDKILVAYINYFKPLKAEIVLYMHRSKEFTKLSKFCESYSINSSANIYIINYINVIKAFMKLKNTFSPLSEGTLVLDIKKNGKYKIEVINGKVDVSETDMPYDISLSHIEASALLFSPSSFIDSAYNFTNPLIKSWFPLPLFYPELDNV